MLAATHLGAVHVVVFGGFAPIECAKRLETATPTIILTASCSIEQDQTLPYLPLIREAISLSTHKPLHTIIWQREEHYTSLDRKLHELPWASLVRSYKSRHGTHTRPPFPQLVRDPSGGVCVRCSRKSAPRTAALS